MGSPIERVITFLGALAGIGAFAWTIFVHQPPKEPSLPGPAPAPTVIVQVVQPTPEERIEYAPQIAAAYSEETVASATPAPTHTVYEPPPEVKPQFETLNRAHVAVAPPPEPSLSAASSALLSVTRFGDHDNVKRLLKNGADPNAAFDDGKTPLILAAENGHHDICKTLVWARANTTMTDRRGRNALHYAAEGGHNDLVQFLLENETPVTAIDIENNTPLMLAEMRGHNTCAAVIRRVLGIMQTPR